MKLFIKNNEIEKIDVLREAPCGSTSETLKEFIGREFNDKVLIDIGLRVQHFCRAGKIRLFVEKEGKKTKAGNINAASIFTSFMLIIEKSPISQKSMPFNSVLFETDIKNIIIAEKKEFNITPDKIRESFLKEESFELIIIKEATDVILPAKAVRPTPGK